MGRRPRGPSLQSQSLREPTANFGDSVGSGLGGGDGATVIRVLPDSPAVPQWSYQGCIAL